MNIQGRLRKMTTGRLAVRVVLVLALLLVPSGVAAPSEPVTAVRFHVSVRETTGFWTNVTLNDAPVFARHIDGVAGQQIDIVAPLARGDYHAYVTPDRVQQGVLEFGASLTEAADSRECPGEFVVTFEVGVASGAERSPNGCTVPTDAMQTLLDEAHTAARARATRDIVHVPLPRDGDRGEALVFDGAGRLYWPNATVVRFAWSAADLVDAYGRATHGARLEYSPLGTFGASAEGTLLQTSQASNANTTEVARFRPAATAPDAWSTSFSDASAGLGQTSASQTRYSFTQPWREVFACAVRSGLQGSQLATRSPIEAPCTTLRATGERAWVGSPREERGFLSVPVYSVLESGDITSVTRLSFADGVAYPLAADRFELRAGAAVIHQAFQLVGLSAGAAPLPDSKESSSEPPAPHAPIDPLHGPESLQASSYPLAAAVDDAFRTPTLTTLRSLLASPDAALIGAVLDRQADASTPAGPLRWWLVFDAPGSASVGVLCERAAAVAPIASSLPAAPATPVGACTQPAQAPRFSQALGPLPPGGLGARDLLTTGASFDDALQRRDIALREHAGESMTFAMYRAWGERVLAVGQAFPTPLTGAPTPTSAQAAFVVLDLGSGRTRLEAVGVQATAGLAAVPALAPSAGLAGTRANSLLSDVPPLLGGTAALVGFALLALLGWAFYTRLTQRAVLGSEARQRILDIVRDEPGIHAAAVLERVGRANGVVEHHLGILVREGFLTRVDTTGFRRYFVTGRFSHSEMRALAALRDGQNEKLYRLIEAHPGIHLSELAQRADLSLAYASRTVKKLQEAGLVDRVQVGRTIVLHAIER